MINKEDLEGRLESTIEHSVGPQFRALVYVPERASYEQVLIDMLAEKDVECTIVRDEADLLDQLANQGGLHIAFFDGSQARHLEYIERTKDRGAYVLVMQKGLTKKSKWPPGVDAYIPTHPEEYFCQIANRMVDLVMGHHMRSHVQTKLERPNGHKHTNTFFLVGGPTGAGKSTLMKALSNREGIEQLVRFTDRRPRPAERHGEDYNFLDMETFRNFERQQKFAFVHLGKDGRSRYAFPASLLTKLKDNYDCFAQFKRFEMRDELAALLKEHLGFAVPLRTVLLYADKRELPHRILERGDLQSNSEQIANRLTDLTEEAEEFYRQRQEFDYFVDTSLWQVTHAERILRNMVLYERHGQGAGFGEHIVRSLFARGVEDLGLDDEPFLEIPEKMVERYVRRNMPDDDVEKTVQEVTQHVNDRAISLYQKGRNALSIFLSTGYPEQIRGHDTRKIILGVINEALLYEPIVRNVSDVFEKRSVFAGFSAKNCEINDGLLYSVSDFDDKPGMHYQVSIGFVKDKSPSSELQPIDDEQLRQYRRLALMQEGSEKYQED